MMKVAVIGSGAAGLTTAWLLDEQFDATVYERDDRLGGHAHTVTVDVQGKPVSVDSGFEFFSDAMFPTLCRLLDVLKVPMRHYRLSFTLFDVNGGPTYVMPPIHSGRLIPASLAPAALLDLLRFNRILQAFEPILRSQDKTMTVAQFLDELHVPEDLRARIVYPFLQAGWGVSVEDIKSFVAYDVLKYPYMNATSGVVRKNWKDIEGGTETYIKTITKSFVNVRLNVSTEVAVIERHENGYRVLDKNGNAEVFDHIVLATNAQQAASILCRIEAAEAIRRHLKQIIYFETTIAVHGDTRLMPPARNQWSTVNMRHDREYTLTNVWKHWKSEVPVIKSWVPHNAHLPEPLYAVTKYLHPRVDRSYFAAQEKLQQLQGNANIWLAGMYMADVDCHESAILSAVSVALRLAPGSARLKMLRG
jgi:predicted NAD/FAD-binding protein